MPFIITTMIAGIFLMIASPVHADSVQMQNPANGHWYQRFDTTMNWHEAKAFCESQGGHLATVTSQPENDFLYENLAAPSPSISWLGGTDELVEGVWVWETGEPWNYDNWYPGEPDNGRGNEDYLHFTAGDGSWIGNVNGWNDLGSCNGGGCPGGVFEEGSYPMSTICEWGVQSCTQAPAGMIGWWPGDGNADDIAGDNSGTLVNGAGYASGKVGPAFNFDGIDDRVVVPDSPSLDITEQITIDAWVNPGPQKTDPYTNGGIIVNKEVSYEIALTAGSGTIRYALQNLDPGWIWIDTGVSVPQDQWTHIALTYDGEAITTYKNGELVHQLEGDGSILPSTYPLGIGARYAGETGYPLIFWTSHFNGRIDEVEIYDRALGAGEIQAIYRAGAAGKCKNHPPVADAGPDQTVEMTSCAGAIVTLDGSASSDPDGDPLTFTWSENDAIIATGVNPTVSLPFGEHTITLTVEDGKGGASTDTVVIHVVDTAPPTLEVTLNPKVLWPPNHKYVRVMPSFSIGRACVETTAVELVSAKSNEPDNGLGDGDTANDIVMRGDNSLSLRAERSGKGSGRVYTITYRATDVGGNVTTASAIVMVPHNR